MNLDKIKKSLPFGMLEEIDSMDGDQLKRRIVESEGILHSNEVAKVEDSDLLGAKERVKELSLTYKEVKKHQNAIVQYSILALHEKGLL